jgi:Icc-related predicted phosphoesterase
MKLWIMSDLHFEFHADGGARFLRSLPDIDHDVAIIAGDLCSFPMIGESLRRVSDRFRRVVYVIGNHECYGTGIQDAVESAAEAAYNLPNVDHIELESMFIDGQRFVGAALWFPYSGVSRHEVQMNDFWQIRGIREDVDSWNRDAVSVLEGATATDVVVTHHLPHIACVDGKYADSPLNDFFVGGAGHVVKGNAPKLWVHGHTHTSLDFHLERTRIVCNPYGYQGNDLNPEFDFGKVVEIGTGAAE